MLMLFHIMLLKLAKEGNKMLEDGDTIEVGGKQGTVCFNTEYNNEKYICVGFLGENLKYDIYKYKYEGEKLLVAKVENEQELIPVLQIFVSQGLDEVGLPQELQDIFEDIED